MHGLPHYCMKATAICSLVDDQAAIQPQSQWRCSKFADVDKSVSSCVGGANMGAFGDFLNVFANSASF